MRLGTSKKEITPNTPIQLAGFAHRLNLVEEVDAPLLLRVMVFERSGEKVVWFIGDLIWWDQVDVKEWKHGLSKKLNISYSSIVFHATHTHSSPQLNNQFSPYLGECNKEFRDKVKAAVFEGALEANQNLTEVQVFRQSGTSEIGVYRRKKIGDSIQMAPNHEQQIDKSLELIRYVTKEGRIIALMVHHNCHPTVSDAEAISPEFPGYACVELERRFHLPFVVYLQGMSGDIRVEITDSSNQFRRGGIQESRSYGQKLAEEVTNVCDDAVLQKVDVTALHGETSYIYLPYDKAEKVLRIEDEYLKYWKGVFEKKIEFHGDWLEVQHISFGKDLRWMCFNAEMAGAYGEYIKSLDSNCLPLGYCNGMIGYVATRQQIEEGGYEALNFIVFFQKPHPFQGEIETTIKDQTAKMLKGEK